MSIMNTLLVFIDNYRTARERARTERLVSELPPEVRKDIGWPSSYNARFANCDGPSRR